jgi:hypothetical protein
MGYVGTSTNALTWCSIIGIFANSTNGFGLLKVNGLSRVPNPPTRIKAFIVGFFFSI